ncbi:MAG TPA: pyrrolo-quinoline quinone [Planctomycetaceae bacterium]|nr:pyrrolo-quinoline quinone [Planctomycetaceae bacterium]HCD03458.1 pyrrolo-quinoline quinone [Planctomycetaceae bacterium]|tara:strand:+ start:3180 stop:4487 length:1308 start_codon:yes stop_codon:yes gene_type:complete
MTSFVRPLTMVLASVLVWLTAVSSATADDWPQWGGPNRDLVWRETGIVKTLPTKGLLPRVWSTPVGEGYSGPAVADGRVYITDYIRNKRIERIHSLDAETGKILWSRTYPVRYSISYPAGPRMTPVIERDRVYTIGSMGDMFCMKVSDGSVIWKKNFVADYGTKLPIWGMVASPLIDGQQLITLVGGTDGSLVVSFDKLTGKELWRSLEDEMIGYCPPVIMTFGKTRQLIVWHPTAISSLDPTNGKLIWQVPFAVRVGLTISTPRQFGNRLFVTAFYNGPMMIEVSPDGRNAKVAWKGKSDSEIKTDGLHSIMTTPIFNGSHIYGICSYGHLRCLDASNGKRIWETIKPTGKDRWWNAFLVTHEDRQFIHNEQGDLIIAKLSPKGYQEISRAKLVEPTRKVRRRMTIWSHPAFALKSVFARNDKELVRVSLAAGK